VRQTQILIQDRGVFHTSRARNVSLLLSQFEIDRRQLSALTKLTDLLQRVSVEKSFRRIVSKDQSLCERANITKQKNDRLLKKISIRNWRSAFAIAKQEIVKSKKALAFLRNSQMLQLKLIIHGIRKTLHKEGKMLA
jgi:hypothetical protein